MTAYYWDYNHIWYKINDFNVTEVLIKFLSFFFGAAAPIGPGLLIHEVYFSEIFAETSTDNTQHTQQTDTCFRWDTSPQSQQASGRKPTP